MNQPAPRSGAKSVHLAWTREQIGRVLGDGSIVAPLSPAAMGAALNRSLPLAADPVALLDSGYGADEVWQLCEALSARVQARLASIRASYFTQMPGLAEPALDQPALLLRAREILHLRAVLMRLREMIGEGCAFVLPDTAVATPHEARMAQAVAMVLAEMAPAAPHTPPLRQAGEAPGIETSGIDYPEAPPEIPNGLSRAILVGSFGLPDPIGLLARLRRQSGDAIIVLAEREFSHLEHFERNWDRLVTRFAPIHLVVPELLPKSQSEAMPSMMGDPAEEEECGSRTEIALAEWVVREAWPRRQAVGAAAASIFDRNTIRQAVISDHVSDSGFAIAGQAGGRECELALETHSGLAMPPAFWLPPLIDTPATLSVWVPAMARHHQRALGDKAAIIRMETRRPNAFGHPWANRGRAVLRMLTRRNHLSTIGVFLTTGQVGFAADIALSPLFEALRTFVAEGVAHGLRFSFRLRAFEDDPDLLRWVLGEDLAMGCEVHRVGEQSLGAFLAEVDVVVEAGAPTSASLIAVARRIPVFRLATEGEALSASSGIDVPALAAAQASAELVQLAGTRSLRLSQAALQIKILE